MGFQQGLSGLNSSSKALDTVGNNIANSGTVGFKSSTTLFGDVYAATLGGGSQVGIGVSVGGISQQFSQGNITVSNNPLDIAINGQGMFRMNNNGATTWTRNGQFNIDKNGYVVNANGSRLTGYLANAANVIVPSSPADIYINTADLQPQPTGGTGGTGPGVKIGLNLDSRQPTYLPVAAAAAAAGAAASAAAIVAGATAAQGLAASTAASASITGGGTLAAAAAAASAAAIGAGATAAQGAAASAAVLASSAPAAAFDVNDPLTYNSSTSATVYDSLGNPHLLSLYFRKTAANNWDCYTNLDGGAASAATGLVFSTNGALTTPATGVVPQTFAVATGATSPLVFDLNLTGSTQYGNIFGVNSITQDGYTSGRLAGLSVAADGTVQGRYSNGQSRDLAQVVLGNFNNPNGLTSLGGNQWAETADSGQPLVGVPGSGSLGVLQSAAMEESNVDLTKELVDMITQQRSYQANAQTIKTQDQILQTLVNLR